MNTPQLENEMDAAWKALQEEIGIERVSAMTWLSLFKTGYLAAYKKYVPKWITYRLPTVEDTSYFLDYMVAVHCDVTVNYRKTKYTNVREGQPWSPLPVMPPYEYPETSEQKTEPDYFLKWDKSDLPDPPIEGGWEGLKPENDLGWGGFTQENSNSQRFACFEKHIEDWSICESDATAFNCEDSYYILLEEEKEEPKYRPWTPEETIGKAFKHKDPAPRLFGKDLLLINRVMDKVCLFNGTQASSNPSGIYRITCDELLHNCIQPDGSPCGVLVEGGAG